MHMYQPLILTCCPWYLSTYMWWESRGETTSEKPGMGSPPRARHSPHSRSLCLKQIWSKANKWLSAGQVGPCPRGREETRLGWLPTLSHPSLSQDGQHPFSWFLACESLKARLQVTPVQLTLPGSSSADPSPVRGSWTHPTPGTPAQSVHVSPSRSFLRTLVCSSHLVLLVKNWVFV